MPFDIDADRNKLIYTKIGRRALCDARFMPSFASFSFCIADPMGKP